jgi:hypothetical protein
MKEMPRSLVNALQQDRLTRSKKVECYKTFCVDLAGRKKSN